jgi:hypothetical protein
VVRTDCRGFRLCLCVVAIFIYESIVRCKGRVQGIYTVFLCVIFIFICLSSVLCEDRLQGI